MNLKESSLLHNGTYMIERVLGQGGFGITYLAVHVRLKKKVAIKEFFPKAFCDRESDTSYVKTASKANSETVEKLKKKFIKEAEHMAAMDSPYIVRITDVFEENHTAYYIMDYIEGRSLSEIVKKDGPLSESKAVEYITKIGEALTYIHSKRMNHLDVKPANVMVRSKDNTPILIDFGLSKQYDSSGNQTSTTPVGISHGFAPMEQYSDGGVKEFSPQTDLYSLAATLYYILSGVVPPQATKLIDEQLTFPQTIPVNLINPISKAMSVGRKNRQENIVKFLVEIKRLESDSDTEIPNQKPKPQPKPQPTPSPTPESEPEEKKSRGWMKWVGICAASAVAILILLVIIGRNSESNMQSAIGENPVSVEINSTKSVTDMYWNSPLGTASYTGEVIQDPEDDSKRIPHGQGVARISGGEYDGNVYNGHFEYGKMEGQTNYKMKNGDTFVGTYKDNRYDKGRYTIKETGEYFEGTFKNGNPDVGEWYDKDGNKL